MTNKIDTLLKTITNRIAGALPSDTVKNPKLNTSPVLSVRSYLTIDPQCSSHPSTSINVVKTCFKKASHSQTSLLQTGIRIGTEQTEEPKSTLEDEFQDLHLNLPAKIDQHSSKEKYMQRWKIPSYSLYPCILGDSNPFDNLADLGSCVNIIPLYLFKKLNIRLLEETDHIFRLADGTKSYLVGIVNDVEVHIGKLKLLNNFYVIDLKKDPKTPLLVGRGFLATANAVIDCRKAKITIGEGITRLYLTRRSLEVLRKFHWMILGGRFNQLSHVSSPLLSRPWEY
ncbi:MAK10-like protein [Tanacetum coccineum]